MRWKLVFWLTLLTSVALANDYEFLGDYASHRVVGSSVEIRTDNRSLTVEAFDQGVLRVQVGELGHGLDELNALNSTPIKVSDRQEQLQLEFAGGLVEVQKHPLRLVVRRPDQSVVVADDPAFGHGWDGKEVRVWKKLEADHGFYGLGEKSGDVNLRGRFFTNWNADTPAYRNDSDPLYCGIPFFSGTSQGQAFGIFFPNSYRSTFNLGAGNKRLFSFGAEDGPLEYFLFLGPEMKDVLSAYTRLSGRMPLPPKWALGYQQCRWSYYPDYEIRDVAKEFRQRDIPADVLYFDIHYMDAYKVFTWHPTRFPQPQSLLRDLKAQGFKVVTIIDPGVKVEKGYQLFEEGVLGDHFLKFLDGELFQGQVWPGWCHFPDFRKSATRAWWGSYNAKQRFEGVSGFWNDMNEPALWGKEMPFVVEGIKALHNRFGLLMAQATYEGLLAENPDLRPFIVTRAGWAGIQRYAAVWTGDNSASFDDLALSIRTNIGLGLSGVPFVGCDIGGFIGRPNPELYTRWMQAASLSPFMRSHTVHDSPDQEPWSFGEDTERRCKQAIERRYSLMPYLYTELHRACQTGLPLYRPLWLEFPGDERTKTAEFQHQFMIGAHLLAAPVIREGQRFQKVYLPEGRWWEVEHQRFHQGGQTVIVEAGLESLPMFYREGGIIPSRAPQQFVDQEPLTELELTVVPAAKGHYEVVLDDGLTTSGPQERLRFEFTSGRELKVTLGKGPRAKALRTLKFRVPGEQPSFSKAKGSRHRSWLRVSASDGVLSW